MRGIPAAGSRERGALGVVGAYPEGGHPDTCMPPFERTTKNAKIAVSVPPPRSDPVFGPSGPLLQYWLET